MFINQFHSGTAVGDAITNQMLLIRDLLRKNGYESEIYAQFIPKELKGSIKPITAYSGNEDAILFVHHSMGFDLFELISNLPDKKVLIYHNITPEEFFEDELTKQAIRKGLQQAKDYKDVCDYYVADSNYNRQELISMGYRSNIDILPVQISLNRFDKLTATDRILKENSNTKNIIFVGRVVRNKRQDDLIKSFVVYNRYYNNQSKLFIIGDTGFADYVAELQNLIKYYKIEDKVIITGKVSEEELKAYYTIADLFLCMSEHEGFGVPLLEAMKMEVPVLAYRSSAIPETMDKAGVIVRNKNYAYIGALINEIITDAELYQKLLDTQKERIDRLVNTDTERIVLDIVRKVQSGDRKRTIQMQGPFETSYSLAIVNRKLSEALDELAEADVSIYCTEGPGDYEPKKKDLADKPHAERLWKKSRNVSYPDVAIRNMYPPRVHDVKGGLNFQAFGWEESVIPKKYIDSFNSHLSGIGTMSDYVTEKLIECGITIPVRTMGIGVELVPNFEELEPYRLTTHKKTKILHISSAFPRKGVDVLLKGYYQAFSDEDDVCLVLKTFPNPHNNVSELLDKLNAQYSHHPEVEWINKDLSTEELNRLYKAADCYVQTARGEGFGLPVAEAMLAKVPVIVSPNSGMADFCTEETALLVDYSLEPASTHLTEGGSAISMWAEPSVDSLCHQLKTFIENQNSDLIRKCVENAYQLITTEFSWKCVAERWMRFIEDVEQAQYKPKVAMVTTWNSKCGIAEFTKQQIEATGKSVDFEIFPNYGVEILSSDKENVRKRLWHSAFEGSMDVLTDALVKSKSDIVHFQFNFGFFKLEHLADAIDRLSKEKKVIISFHKTEDADVGGKKVSLRKISKQLNRCSALVVHQKKDVDQLVEMGVDCKLIHLIPLGQITYPYVSPRYMRKQMNINQAPVLGSYGFFLPHKGIKEVIIAIAELKKKYPTILYMPVCALHDSVESREYFQECRDIVRELNLENNVRFETDFLPNDQSIRYLQCCDMLMMPYKPTGESASGAIRFCLAVQRPILTTQESIFDEFRECTYQIPVCEPQSIANAIDALYESDEGQKHVDRIVRCLTETRWHATADRFRRLYTSF